MTYGTLSDGDGFHSATAPAAVVAPAGDVALDVDGTIIVLEDDQVRPANGGCGAGPAASESQDERHPGGGDEAVP